MKNKVIHTHKQQKAKYRTHTMVSHTHNVASHTHTLVTDHCFTSTSLFLLMDNSQEESRRRVGGGFQRTQTPPSPSPLP